MTNLTGLAQASLGKCSHTGDGPELLFIVSELIPSWTCCLDDRVSHSLAHPPCQGKLGRVINAGAMAPPVLTAVTLLVGKGRRCVQPRKECRGQRVGRATGMEPDAQPGRNFPFPLLRLVVAEAGGRKSG
jgi:hypothetical protein